MNRSVQGAIPARRAALVPEAAAPSAMQPHGAAAPPDAVALIHRHCGFGGQRLARYRVAR